MFSLIVMPFRVCLKLHKSCFSFHHSTCKFLLASYKTEDAYLTRNRFPSKMLCEQIRLFHLRGTSPLECAGHVQPESSQSYEGTAWQAVSSDTLLHLSFIIFKLQMKILLRLYAA